MTKEQKETADSIRRLGRFLSDRADEITETLDPVHIELIFSNQLALAVRVRSESLRTTDIFLDSEYFA